MTEQETIKEQASSIDLTQLMGSRFLSSALGSAAALIVRHHDAAKKAERAYEYVQKHLPEISLDKETFITAFVRAYEPYEPTKPRS